MDGPRAFVNRELSWLEFNQRVLDEACDARNPLIERARFLAITASNLDEFFMVRVGSLKAARDSRATPPDPAGLSVPEQIERIAERVRVMVAAQYRCLSEDLEPALLKRGIVRLRPESLNPADKDYLEGYFRSRVEPVLSPVSVGAHRPMPLIPNLGLNLAFRVSAKRGGPSQHRLAVVWVGKPLDRLVAVESRTGFRFVLLEDIVRLFLGRLFPDERIGECVAFRIARNADMAVDEDGDIDLASGISRVLKERRRGECVRLEIEAGASASVLGYLKRQFGVGDEGLYEVPGPLDLTFLHGLAGAPGFEDLRFRPWPPVMPPGLDPARSMFEQIARGDVLLLHPFESFEPVVRLVEEAAEDLSVVAIKMTLYRTSSDSRIVQALSRAALNGKHVTALVELKARFDEARNIRWARQLEEDGVQVIHGVRGLKTHAKVCLIVRREPAGTVRYLHFGTGNYNETTATQYTDISLLTCNEVLGQDATAFFNAVTGYSVDRRFQAIAMAPSGLRQRLLELIRDETERKRNGQESRIMAKMNALVDPVLIEALYEASRAGVPVLLNVRGICCLRPGVRGLSENIRVVSVVGRFLEHSRVFYFAHGGDGLVFLSSADWMPRNLDRRVELMVPVQDSALRKRLTHLLEMCCDDPVRGREIRADGSYVQRVPPSSDAVSSQEQTYREVVRQQHEGLLRQPRAFEPHEPVRRDGETAPARAAARRVREAAQGGQTAAASPPPGGARKDSVRGPSRGSRANR